MVTTSSATTPSVVPASLATVGGYTLRPAPDITRPAGEGDRAPPAFYEVVPPTGQAVPTLGRVWASCSCLKAEAFDEIPGRALVRVRKVAAAPSAGDGFLLMVWLRVPENVVLQHTLPK